MAATRPSSSTRKISATARPRESSTSRLSSTSLSRSSSKSSDLSSVSSSTTFGQTVDSNADDQLYRDCQQARPSELVNSLSYRMSQRSSQTHDELDFASRRSSGRTRKLTEKYQALTGSKLLPTHSANIASEELATPTKTDGPDELLQVIKSRRRSSTAIARSDPPQAVASPSPALIASPEINAERDPQLTAVDVVEESPKRTMRRERKPTAKFLESIVAREASDDTEEQSKRTSQRRRKSSAKAVEVEAAPTPPDSPMSPPKVVPQRRVSPISPKLSTSPTEAEAEAQPIFVAPRKRSGSPPNGIPQAKTRKLASTTSSPVPELAPAPASANSSTSPGKSPARTRPSRLSLKPPRRPSNLRFAVSTAEDEVGNATYEPVEAKKAPKSAYKTTDEKLKRPVNGVTTKPHKVVTLRYGVAPARLSEMRDATPIRFSPMVVDQNETEAQEKTCNLFCLSPSSRILAFAQLAAESTDSDEEDDDDDSDDDDNITRPSSYGLYEKWIARGRERFCVCNKQAATHAHPASPKSSTSNLQPKEVSYGVSTLTPKDPFLSDLREDAEKAVALPPVNSIIRVSEGRRVSALYSAITDNASAARPGKSTTSATKKQRPSVPTNSKSFEERMSEDYRALEAIRDQATMEGVKVRNNMDYKQIKALLDEHRMDASNSIGHGHGLVKVNSTPVHYEWDHERRETRVWREV